MTRFNKNSYRACGCQLSVTETCKRCREPVHWECSRCGRMVTRHISIEQTHRDLYKNN